MSDKILLSYPVSAEDFDRAVRLFPQYRWAQADRDSEDREIADAAIVYGKPRDHALALATKLKWLQSPSAGVEHLAALNVFKKGSFFLTTAAGMHESCVQHAIALLLSFSRRVALHARSQDSLHWESRAKLEVPLVLEGQTLGILGLGAIGRRIAVIAKVLGMRTIGFNHSGSHVAEPDETYSIAKLDQHLSRFDALIMILPATPDTDNLLNADRIAKLPRHCIVVNVGRGNAIDEPALITALKEHCIAGAALDVFKQEPLPSDSEFYSLPNCVITPHIGGNRPDYDAQAFAVFLDNLKRFTAGEPLKNVVERGRGY